LIFLPIEWLTGSLTHPTDFSVALQFLYPQDLSDSLVSKITEIIRIDNVTDLTRKEIIIPVVD